MPAPNNWTPERIQAATDMWQRGLSAGQIAAELGDLTRNAVIGKIHRLGLHRPEKVRDVTAAITNSRRAKAARRTAPRPKAKPKPVVKIIGNAQTFVQAEAPPPKVVISARKFEPLEGCAPVPFGASGCKWPVGGVGADLVCCGQRKVDGRSYCRDHLQASLAPPKPGMTARALMRQLRRHYS